LGEQEEGKLCAMARAVAASFVSKLSGGRAGSAIENAEAGIVVGRTDRTSEFI